MRHAPAPLSHTCALSIEECVVRLAVCVLWCICPTCVKRHVNLFLCAGRHRHHDACVPDACSAQATPGAKVMIKKCILHTHAHAHIYTQNTLRFEGRSNTENTHGAVHATNWSLQQTFILSANRYRIHTTQHKHHNNGHTTGQEHTCFPGYASGASKGRGQGKANAEKAEIRRRDRACHGGSSGTQALRREGVRGDPEGRGRWRHLLLSVSFVSHEIRSIVTTHKRGVRKWLTTDRKWKTKDQSDRCTNGPPNAPDERQWCCRPDVSPKSLLLPTGGGRERIRVPT
mmetsp:Transcript_83859/g.139939  ORF Transcript_83859/g.139939 Transcript_83859/m.139939 type:complete len:286 (-) Transcript_83859:884-1741(-)